MKVNNQVTSSHLNKLYKNFTNGIKKKISEDISIKPMSYSCQLHDLGMRFEQQNQRTELNRLSSRFAEFLVSVGEQSLAGITYSFLIKLNKGNIKFVEEIAIKALAIAKRQHDPVHIMARANDLKKIYEKIEPGSDRHIKILYEIKRALNNICKNYASSQKRFMSVSTKMKPLKQYELMLASIQIDLGKALQLKDPKLATEELLTAKKTFIQLGYTDKVEVTDKILRKINSCK